MGSSSTSPVDPTRRFSKRVANYVKYRPHYPEAVLNFLRAKFALSPNAVIADIGSGTGILAQLFLRNGNFVYGVEPNEEMRAAGETQLAAHEAFESRNGTAEATGLADKSIDVIVVGQAFHWFDPYAAKAEFTRILRTGGYVVLVWNSRDYEATPLMRDYEALLNEVAEGYQAVGEKNTQDDDIAAFFAPNRFTKQEFQNVHLYDRESLIGRALSSSYSPLPGSSGHKEFVERLQQLFSTYERGGQVPFEYSTRLYCGSLGRKCL